MKLHSTSFLTVVQHFASEVKLNLIPLSLCNLFPKLMYYLSVGHAK